MTEQKAIETTIEFQHILISELQTEIEKLKETIKAKDELIESLLMKEKHG